MIGLDIGSSAVRAVELGGTRDRPRLVRFAQLGLERGVVADGEVRDAESLAATLRRLWAQGGFSGRTVNLSIGGQRVIVREADVTWMSAEDFRTAMVFEVQDLIPIPTADAVMDFSILGESEPSSDGRRRMRIALGAADKRAVQRLLDTVKAAGLDVAAIDVPQAAILRTVTDVAPGQPVALVSVGADLTTVILRTQSQTFSRTLAIGASEVTKGVGVRLGIDSQEAEAVKRYAGGTDRAAARAGTLVVSEARPLVEQVLESLDYFSSQAGIIQLDRVLLTGGGALTAGLIDELASASGTTVEVVDPFAGVDVSALAPAVVERARPVAAQAMGLAEWSWESSGARLTLLPPEILEAERRRRAMVGTVAAGVALALGLSALWYSRHQEAHSVAAQAATVNAQSTALHASSAALSGVTSYFSAVDGRQSQLKSLGGGFDWPTLISQIESALPPPLTLQTISLASTAATSSPGAAASAPTSATVQMTIAGPGGEQLVASYLKAMGALPSLASVAVPSSATAAGVTSFTSTATVTSKAPKITYAWEASK